MYIIPIVIAVILTGLAFLVYYMGKEKRFWRFALIVIIITIAIRISDPALAKLLES
jgi:heme/copper-type cytochrome/quinol oxidase subunit 4